MSPLVFAIAALPALVVIYVACNTRSKAAIVLTAILAAGVGVLTGNPTYMGVDLVCVAFALYISWNIAKTPLERTPEEIERRRLARIKAQEDQAKWDNTVDKFTKYGLLVGAVVLFVWWEYSFPTKQSVSAIPPSAPAVAAPAAALQPPAQPQQIAKQPAPAPRKPRTAEQCLKIANERAMVRCLERAP